MRKMMIRLADISIVIFVVSLVLTQTAMASSGWYKANGSNDYVVRNNLVPGQVYSLTIGNSAWIDGLSYDYWTCPEQKQGNTYLGHGEIAHLTFTATTANLRVHLESSAYFDVWAQVIVTPD